MASSSGTGHDTAAFLTVTTYDVWFRADPDSKWRLWQDGYVEQHHANTEARKVTHSPAASPTRETRVARRTLTVEWLDA